MKFVKLVNMAVLAITLSACGKQGSLFQNVQVKSDEANGQVWLSAQSEINLGSLQVAGVTIPIFNPKNPSELLGRVALQRSVDSKNIMLIEANLTALSRNQLQTGGTLPNGQPLPITGMPIGSININGNSKFYIGAQNDTVVFGAAVAIKGFDEIGKYVPGVNLFFDIPASNGVSGVGGAFTGPQSGQNGLALFVKVSQPTGQVQTLAMKGQRTQVTLVSNDKQVSSTTQSRLLQRMLMLDQRVKLQVH